MPTGGIERKASETEKGCHTTNPASKQLCWQLRVEDANDLLVRAGFIRQPYSGVFHMLPLGLRVQNKLEALIDTQMQSLGKELIGL